MPYDSSLDEKHYSESWESETSRIVVSVYSYNQGQKKLQISRENKTSEGEYRFSKLGRMTKEEVEAILPYIQEAAKHMD